MGVPEDAREVPEKSGEPWWDRTTDPVDSREIVQREPRRLLRRTEEAPIRVTVGRFRWEPLRNYEWRDLFSFLRSHRASLVMCNPLIY